LRLREAPRLPRRPAPLPAPVRRRAGGPRREPRPGGPPMTRRSALALACALAAAAAAGVVLVGGTDAYRVRAEFRDASGLRSGSQVKVGGVVVGQVAGIAITGRDTARATLALDRRRVGAIGAGARAEIRPLNLLGEKFVDLRPGDQAHPAPDGSAIP